MSNSFSQIYIHLVLSVQGESSLILPSWEEKLYRYITGLITNKQQKLLAINGMPDHVHIFFNMQPECNLSNLVMEIKKSSNRFINENRLSTGKFYWQKGYGAFSYSRSAISDVINYIMNQKEHHKKKEFKEEYIEFLRNFGVDYNEKYLFDWVSY